MRIILIQIKRFEQLALYLYQYYSYHRWCEWAFSYLYPGKSDKNTD